MYDFEEKHPSEVPIVILDTETTGLYPGLGHRIVEIGAVRLEGWREVGQFNMLLQPGRKMDPKATAVNGIDDMDLMGQPSFAEVAEELLSFIEGALLVAHNARFDADFLGMELFATEHARQPHEPAIPNPWLCTLLLARRFFHFGQNNLGHVARRLGVRMGQAHRALSDVYMTAAILKRMVRELATQKLVTVGDLLHAQGTPIFTPPPPNPFLPDIIDDALANGRDVRILYLGNSGESNRIITPLYPTQHRGVAYLIAYCHTARDQRTFRVDRIFSANLVA